MGQAAGNSRAFLRAAGFVMLLGRVRLQIPTADNRELCLESPVPGVCPGSFDRWYYNRAFQDCQRFTSGGCLGNENNFLSFDVCIETCGKIKRGPSFCSSPKDVGLCSASLRRFYYNIASRTCVAFIYTGCGGNNNNFRTKKDCMNACKHVQVIEAIKLPPIVIQFLFFS
ncbi:tissue factor pathway inhibitor-like isoform X3 [Podarcis raffonei]|uniref:tissue factor pathway inhibitor-like isoform X3 n=1 Tax=Podarcis raffonei TaxID=65483 RepID=UPI0023291471|nr:tissue factor pathway inhibitor-like isoform X3 [Podarcis raffonei]